MSTEEPKSDETSLNTNDKPDDINSLSTKSQGYMEEGLEPILGNLPIESIATMVWQNINPAVKDVIRNKLSRESLESKANEEGIASVSGPADSSAIIGTGVHVKPEDDEEVEQNDPVLLNEAYVEDQFGYIYRPVYTNESRKIINDDLDYNGKLYTVEGVGNCPMCRGAGKVTVERLGLKECPKCDGSGDIQAEQEMPPQMEVPMAIRDVSLLSIFSL